MSAPPTATKAPVHTGTKSYRKVIVAAIAATFPVGFLFGCCAASVVFWMFPRAQGLLPKGIKGAVNKLTGKSIDDMTFQELEDRLNSAGLHVSRTSSRRVPNSMWFGEGINKKGVTPAYIRGAEEGGSFLLFQRGLFHVTNCSDWKQAQEVAAKFKDIQQRPVFAWGPFVFKGKKEVLDNVKAALD